MTDMSSNYRTFLDCFIAYLHYNFDPAANISNLQKNGLFEITVMDRTHLVIFMHFLSKFKPDEFHIEKASIIFAPDPSNARIMYLEDGPAPPKAETGDDEFDRNFLILGRDSSIIAKKISKEARRLLIDNVRLRPETFGLDYQDGLSKLKTDPLHYQDLELRDPKTRLIRYTEKSAELCTKFFSSHLHLLENLEKCFFAKDITKDKKMPPNNSLQWTRDA